MKKIFGMSLSGKSIQRLGGLSRDQYILASVTAFLLLAALLIGYDGYLFYQDVIDRSRGAPVTPLSVRFSEQDLEEIMTLLDEREKKFAEILSSR